MSKIPKFSPEQIDLIQSVLNSISSKEEIAIPKSRRSMKGRRYSLKPLRGQS